MSRVITVEPLLLAVLQQIVLVPVAFIIENVCLRGRSQCLHALDVLRFLELHGGEPPAVHALIAGVGRGTLTDAILTGITSMVHDRPCIHAKIRRTLRIVEVWQTEAMAELMTRSADAVGRSTTGICQFTRHGIRVDPHTIQQERPRTITFVFGRIQVILMRPDGILTGSRGF